VLAGRHRRVDPGDFSLSERGRQAEVELVSLAHPLRNQYRRLAPLKPAVHQLGGCHRLWVAVAVDGGWLSRSLALPQKVEQKPLSRGIVVRAARVEAALQVQLHE